MRVLTAIAATVMLASVVQIDRISITPLQAADRVADVLAGARKALGGADKLAAVKAISAEGPFRRSMGQRDMEGTITLLLLRDKYRRSEEMQMGGMVNGPTIERISVFNGTEAWDDVQNNAAGGGPGGGGFRMEIRTDGPGGPGGAGRGAGPGGGMLTPEQLAEQRVRRAKVEMQRWTIALLADTTQPWVDAGIAESPDGKADMLDTKDENGRDVRLFIDQASHLPLMLQYQEIRPQIMMAGGPGRGGPGRGGPGAAPGTAAPGTPAPGTPPTPEEMQARLEEMRKNPPKPSTFAMHLTDYQKVDGIMLPHKIDIAIDGQPNEEWTIEKYKLNPTVKADVWARPKK
ncbi:MAG: hypothetical protein ABI665_06560 [Vicinamibacterales bacterium]